MRSRTNDPTAVGVDGGMEGNVHLSTSGVASQAGGGQTAIRSGFFRDMVKALLPRNLKEWIRRKVDPYAVAKLHEYERGTLLGHYYSPVPSRVEIDGRRTELFDLSSKDLAGVDLEEAGQLRLLSELAPLSADLPFENWTRTGARYTYRNLFFMRADAMALSCLLRCLRPKRIVEVGGGFSSAVILDTLECCRDLEVDCTFIDPDPSRLNEVLRPGDRDRITIHERPVQAVETAIFERLEPGDILFIDSSHVSKLGSDVNFYFFELLPRVQRGVWVHIHDIFSNFEYPELWFDRGWFWNEIYLLRAFLQYNSAFAVRLFNNWLARHHLREFQEAFPECDTTTAQSLWLEKK